MKALKNHSLGKSDKTLLIDRILFPIIDYLMMSSSISKIRKPSAGRRAALAEHQLIDQSPKVVYQIYYVHQSIYIAITIGIRSAEKRIYWVTRPAIAGIR